MDLNLISAKFETDDLGDCIKREPYEQDLRNYNEQMNTGQGITTAVVPLANNPMLTSDTYKAETIEIENTDFDLPQQQKESKDVSCACVKVKHSDGSFSVSCKCDNDNNCCDEASKPVSKGNKTKMLGLVYNLMHMHIN